MVLRELLALWFGSIHQLAMVSSHLTTRYTDVSHGLELCIRLIRPLRASRVFDTPEGRNFKAGQPMVLPAGRSAST